MAKKKKLEKIGGVDVDALKKEILAKYAKSSDHDADNIKNRAKLPQPTYEVDQPQSTKVIDRAHISTEKPDLNVPSKRYVGDERVHFADKKKPVYANPPRLSWIDELDLDSSSDEDGLVDMYFGGSSRSSRASSIAVHNEHKGGSSGDNGKAISKAEAAKNLPEPTIEGGKKLGKPKAEDITGDEDEYVDETEKKKANVEVDPKRLAKAKATIGKHVKAKVEKKREIKKKIGDAGGVAVVLTKAAKGLKNLRMKNRVIEKQKEMEDEAKAAVPAKHPKADEDSDEDAKDSEKPKDENATGALIASIIGEPITKVKEILSNHITDMNKSIKAKDVVYYVKTKGENKWKIIKTKTSLKATTGHEFPNFKRGEIKVTGDMVVMAIPKKNVNTGLKGEFGDSLEDLEDALLN